jgi:hypothetical protein
MGTQVKMWAVYENGSAWEFFGTEEEAQRWAAVLADKREEQDRRTEIRVQYMG